MTRYQARTPMQWSEEKNAGFTTGTPWMKVNPNCSYINVEKELKRENSILSFYKKLIEIRKSSEALSTGSFVPVDIDNKKVLSYLRQQGEETYLIVINLSGSLAEANLMDVSAYNFKPVLCTYDALPFMPSMKLQPYEGRLYKV